MNWWCSATGAEWTWQWQPYPGVWLFVLSLVAGYGAVRWRLLRAHPSRNWPGWRTALFLVGTVLLWLATDWPLGTLGAGYLLSAHTAQYLLLALMGPALVLLGFPGWAAEAAWNARAGRLLRGLVRPVPSLLAFNAILFVTHVPSVVDGLMPSQLGSLAIDLSWIVGGLWLWWPALAPERAGGLSPMGRIGYLFASTVPPTIPAAFLTFADYPLYGLYELAPRVGLSAHDDQQLAGLLMKFGADPVIWLAMAVIFFRWQAAITPPDSAAAESPAPAPGVSV